MPVSNRDIRQEYPELKKYKEFENMEVDELKFCWYVACFFEGEEEADKWKKSLEQSGLGKRLAKKDYLLYESGNPPSRLKNAIIRFKSFNISSRLEARWITENVLYNYRVLSATDVKSVGMIKIYGADETTEIGEKRDWNQVNAFVSAMGKIVEEIPGLIAKTEEGYGIKLDFNDISVGKNIRDDFIHRKAESGI